MNKRRLHQYVTILRRVKTWQLVVVLFLVLLAAASLLRLNNIGMVERREAVIQADRSGDAAATKEALVGLQHYISSHMNTDLDKGVYLVAAYERDRNAAIEAAGETNNPNSDVYQQASVECRARFQGGVDSFRNDYVQCVINRVAELGEGEDPAAGLQLPRADAYRYDFASPLWTPDAAGLTVLLAVIITLIIIGRLIGLGILHLLLKRHYQST